MLLRRVVAPFLQANCYVIAPARGGGALVVDPGAGSAEAVARVLEAADLHVAAVLATHGHADHVWDAAAVAGDAPVYVPGPDLYRMDNPLAARLPGEPDFSAMLATPWVRPSDVREVPAAHMTGGGAPLVEGVTVRVVPAPGHTEGSTLTLLGDVDAELGGPADGTDPGLADIAGAVDEARRSRDAARGTSGATSTAAADTTTDTTATATDAGPVGLALAGDVVFRGSIGRTDLAGGDPEVMTWTLRTLAASIDPATVLLPGHGPATWWGRELARNPYVRMARLQQ